MRPIGIALLATVGLLAQSQTAVPQFRAGVELIPIDVTVLDDKRQAVRGLTAADFTVLENGVERPIRAFTPVELANRVSGNEAAWSSAVAPDVATNAGANEEGRLVVILMDRSIPAQEPTLAARRIARAAVEGLGPHDLGAVVSTSNGAVQDSTIQNFTADRARLLRAIDAQGPSAEISREAKAIWAAAGLEFDQRQDGSCLCGLCVLETITRVADAVRDTPRRRKLLLFIGSNVIWQSMRPTAERGADPGCETPLEDARNALFASVDRANLTVHSIDPQGLVNVGPHTLAATPNRQGPIPRPEQQQREMNELLSHQQNLRLLPDRTGGRTITGRNYAETAIADIFRESEAYYLLGIDRESSQRPDRPRAIEVKVRRRGVRAFAQRQYMPSAAAGESATLPGSGDGRETPIEALARLLPRADLPLTMAVAAVAGTDNAKATVRINVDAAAFARGAAAAVALDVVVVATDHTGRPVASARQTSTLSAVGLAPKTPTDVNVSSQLVLPPGDYGFRVAMLDTARGRVASVFSDVTVPDFASDPLSLSGVTLEVARTATAKPEATTRRSFRRVELVRALLQVYQGTQRNEAPASVPVRVQIVDAKGAAVRDQKLTFDEQTFRDRRADCLITLPLANLAPGEYLLRLDATLDRRRAGRALRFVVE